MSRRERKGKKGMNREIMIVTYLFVLIFVGIAAFYIYFVQRGSDEYLTSPYNTRQDILADSVKRGNILSNDGTVLATTTVSGSEQTRNYPFRDMYAHVLGYASHGKSGVERAYNYYMLRSHVNVFEQVSNTYDGQLNDGDSVVTTLDHELQQIAHNALRRYDGGAVVAIDPQTGKILCMASTPGFDPNTLDRDWETINADQESGLLVNRATAGRYMPGSTFKIVTALAYYRQFGQEGIENFTYDCGGTFSYGDYHIDCDAHTSHGTVNFTEAFANSCNGAFISMGLQLDKQTWIETAEDLLYNGSTDFALSNNSGSFSLTAESDTWETMLTSIGQGNTVVTPFQNALIACIVANDGQLMDPYVVDHIETSGGTHVRSFRASSFGRRITQDEAAFLEEIMIAVVNEGTAGNLRADYQVAGKTGTAQNTSQNGDANALFTGYAPADDPRIVVSVVVEGGGRVSGAATGIARDIFDAYLG